MLIRMNFGSFAVIPVALLCLSAFHPTTHLQERAKSDEPVVVLAEVQNHRIIYKVNDRDAEPNLLGAMNTIGDQRGRDTKVVVLVDSRAPITEIGNIDGTLGKAGFTIARFFVFNKEANIMSTVEFGRAQPFSRHPSYEP